MAATNTKDLLEELSAASVHVGSSKSRRHPSQRDYIFGTKGDREIIDLDKSAEDLGSALDFVRTLSGEGKTLLLVGNKNEARAVVSAAAEKLTMPYVASRWIGGTITNFKEVRKRVDRYIELREKKEKKELGMYTKREQALLAKEAADLEKKFGGIVDMTELPKALLVIDSNHEAIAVREAKMAGIPVVGLASSDCDIHALDYPISGNDSSVASISLIVDKIVAAYQDGKKLTNRSAPAEQVAPLPTEAI